MNFFNPRSLSLVAATAVLTAISMVQTEAAHAFLIKRTPGTPAASTINPSLAAPTVLDFNSQSGDVPTTATSIGSGTTGDSLNGGAKIREVSGSANYTGTALQVGLDSTTGNNPPPRNGAVSLTFDDPRGMGYFGFLLAQTPNNAANATISFISKINDSVTTFTMAQLLGNSVPTPNVIVGNGNYFSFFVTNNSEIFDEVRFADLSTANNAGFLRVDNVAYQAIPTPALLPGLVALGIGAVRKRKAEAEAEA